MVEEERERASMFRGSEKFQAWLRAEREQAAELLLGRFPWQEYPYKRGKWRRDTIQWPFWSEWKQTAQSLLLLDPATGRGLGELWDVEPPSWLGEHGTSGRIQVAGDPRLFALVSLTDRPDRAHLAIHRRYFTENPVQLFHRLVGGDLSLKPYYDADVEPVRYGGSLWLADRPQEPTRADGYHWHRWDSDDPVSYNRDNGSIWARYRRETKNRPS
ncbi:hypothetical protein [Streptacidiphilus monticola]|uniref:DUF4238 domain-containing protein n=1 Tax=Streptacidiphilus monticola TaxID=2161674 RepID=A0ABW1FXF7_9ACTN